MKTYINNTPKFQADIFNSSHGKLLPSLHHVKKNLDINHLIETETYNLNSETNLGRCDFFSCHNKNRRVFRVSQKLLKEKMVLHHPARYPNSNSAPADWEFLSSIVSWARCRTPLRYIIGFSWNCCWPFHVSFWTSTILLRSGGEGCLTPRQEYQWLASSAASDEGWTSGNPLGDLLILKWPVNEDQSRALRGTATAEANLCYQVNTHSTSWPTMELHHQK